MPRLVMSLSPYASAASFRSRIESLHIIHNRCQSSAQSSIDPTGYNVAVRLRRQLPQPHRVTATMHQKFNLSEADTCESSEHRTHRPRWPLAPRHLFQRAAVEAAGVLEKQLPESVLKLCPCTRHSHLSRKYLSRLPLRCRSSCTAHLEAGDACKTSL